MTEEERKYLLKRREALLIEVRALEDYLKLPRSSEPKRKHEPQYQGQKCVANSH